MDQPSCCCQYSAREILILKDEPAVTGSLGMSEHFSFSFSLTVSFSLLLKKKAALLGTLMASVYRRIYSMYQTGCHEY